MSILQNLLNLFLQINCPLCERATPNQICEYCVQQLHTYRYPNSAGFWQNPLPLFVWGIYDGSLKRVIKVAKYENQPQIALLLGQWLGKAWLFKSPLSSAKVIVTPIPLHTKKLSQRGYNQAALIAQGFCQITGLKLQKDGLNRIKETQPQYSLSAVEREKNLSNAFTVSKPLLNHLDRSVLLVDDIYTTGSTAKSAQQTLHQSGFAVLGIAVVAATLK